MGALEVEIVDNMVGIPAVWFMQVCGVSPESYRQMVVRKHLIRLRRGGGSRGSSAVIQWSNMPERFRSIILQYGNPDAVTRRNILVRHLCDDSEARAFFENYTLADGRGLPEAARLNYYANAVVLNGIRGAMTFKRTLYNSGTAFWDGISRYADELDRRLYPHSLPSNGRRLQDRFNVYIKEGYGCLISRSFGNQSSRKVTGAIENLILSIYCKGNKPYGTWVVEDYLLFLAGRLDIVDIQTGEVYDRAAFYDSKGAPVTVSRSTAWNYINSPANMAVINSVRMGYHRFNHLERPHYHRSPGQYSLSKISLDDRDLPRRLHSGGRVKAYYVYDVVSGALIGAAYSRKKNAPLFIGSLRDMFLFLYRNDWGIPMEAEVENHLVRTFEDDLMAAGTVFPYVRWCAPTNSQEKHAEQFNRQKKYGYEKRYQDGIGRFYAKNPSNVTDGERVYDEATDRYTFKETTYGFNRLVADDRQSIEAYNSGLHRDQKTYPGKTRMDVLRENLNPNLQRLNRPLLAKYIGESVETGIRRNQYCRVQHGVYMLPTADILARLAPGNYTVTAWWIAGEDGDIPEVYLYQNGEYLCTAAKVQRFTTANAEWTEADEAAMTGQAKYISHFDSLVKEGRKSKISKVETMEVRAPFALLPAPSGEKLPSPYDEEEAAAEYSLDELIAMNADEPDNWAIEML